MWQLHHNTEAKTTRRSKTHLGIIQVAGLEERSKNEQQPADLAIKSGIDTDECVPIDNWDLVMID